MKFELNLEIGNKDIREWTGFSIPILSTAAALMAAALILISL